MAGTEVHPGIRPWLKSSSIFNQAAAARKGLGLCVLPHFIASNHPDPRMVLPGEVRLERTCRRTCHRDLRPIPRERAVIAFMAETLPKHAGALNWPASGAAG